MDTGSSFTIKKYFFAAVIAVTFLAFSFFVYAAAPSGGYAPGATLDPSCVPNTTDCIVNLPTDWGILGNAGTNGGNNSTPATNFIGTTDAQDLVFEADGNEVGRLYNAAGSSVGSVAFGGGKALAPDMFVYGNNAGVGAVGANDSMFIGMDAGYGAGDLSRSALNPATFSVYDSYSASTPTSYSIFIGTKSGYGSTDAAASDFLGYEAGDGATYANTSNFFGYQSGFGADGAKDATAIGYQAGYQATGASESNFIGTQAGYESAGDANFMGFQAGYNATNALNSVFIGNQAGYGATNAANSIFIGNQAGFKNTISDTVNNVMSGTSILIGDNTSTGGNSNSIALGASATNTEPNQLMIGSATSTGYIDQMVIDLDDTGTQTCVIDVTGANCSSDERLKTNIADLPSDTLDMLDKVRTVTFNWDSNPTGSQSIGFLAQDIDQEFPQVVSTNADGYYMVNYGEMAPVLVESIRELNLKLDDFANEIHTNNLCVGNVCVTQAQFLQMVQASQTSSPQTPPPALPQGEGAATQTPAVIAPIITPPTTDPSSSTVTSDVSDTSIQISTPAASTVTSQ